MPKPWDCNFEAFFYHCLQNSFMIRRILSSIYLQLNCTSFRFHRVNCNFHTLLIDQLSGKWSLQSFLFPSQRWLQPRFPHPINHRRPLPELRFHLTSKWNGRHRRRTPSSGPIWLLSTIFSQILSRRSERPPEAFPSSPTPRQRRWTHFDYLIAVLRIALSFGLILCVVCETEGYQT